MDRSVQEIWHAVETLHALSLEDILTLQKFTGVGTSHNAVDPRRCCPTNAEIQALVKQNRKLTTERLWRRLRPLDFSSSNLGSLTTRANSNHNHNHNQRGRGSQQRGRSSGSVLGGENGESSDAESEEPEEEDDGMDGDGNVRARARTAPKKGPKSKENKAEQLCFELLGHSISRKLFEPRPSAPQDPLRQLRVENEHALYAGQPLNTANSERQQPRKFCIWMAAQDLEEPGRFDRIDGKRIFDYMQFIGSPRDETGLYYSASTIKLQLTMVNRFKARQEVARGVPEPSPDELALEQDHFEGLEPAVQDRQQGGAQRSRQRCTQEYSGRVRHLHFEGSPGSLPFVFEGRKHRGQVPIW